MKYLAPELSGLLSFPHRSQGTFHGLCDDKKYHMAERRGAFKVFASDLSHAVDLCQEAKKVLLEIPGASPVLCLLGQLLLGKRLLFFLPSFSFQMFILQQ